MPSPSLAELAAAPCNRVNSEIATVKGRAALRLRPIPGLPLDQLIDKPSFARLPLTLADGTVEVALLSRLLPDAPDFARGFAGLAFRIQPDLAFESVYLRPLNGAGLNPPAPRHLRAIQYFAYPDWDFQRLRDTHPDGTYEAPADIRTDTWHHLRLTLSGRQVTAHVDGLQVLQVTAKVPPLPGDIGLWVDVGTEAFFTDLRTTPTSP